MEAGLISDKYTCFFYEDDKNPKLLTKTVSLGMGGKVVQTGEEHDYQHDAQDRVTVGQKTR